MKIYEVPVIVRRPDANAMFTSVEYMRTLGLACAGSTLMFQQIQATIAPLLGHLLNVMNGVPSVADVAEFVCEVGNRYLHSLGAARPHSAHVVEMVLGGWCDVERQYVALRLTPVMSDQRWTFSASPVDLATPQFFGHNWESAKRLCIEMGAGLDGIALERIPLRVLRRIVDDPSIRPVGGDVQLGYTVNGDFKRVQTFRPPPHQGMWLNGISTFELPAVGPCQIGLDAMAVSG